jgi:hypothetical protein
MPGRRPPKAIPTEELAGILAYAELHGDKAAAAQFSVSARTLQRYREGMRAGRHPELAALVDQKKAGAAKQCADLLVETYERGLQALARRIDDTGTETRMKDRDLVGAVHILGNQLVTRNALAPDDEQQPTRSDRAGQTAPAAGAAGQGPPAGEGGRAGLH